MLLRLLSSFLRGYAADNGSLSPIVPSEELLSKPFFPVASAPQEDFGTAKRIHKTIKKNGRIALIAFLL
jgi:hypothetical protein